MVLETAPRRLSFYLSFVRGVEDNEHCGVGDGG